MPHESCFTFRTHGGVCAGEEWIYDHDEPIARLRRGAVEQPEQNLRYFDQVPCPVELRDLRLSPGQRPLIAGLQLYWKLGPVITRELVSIEVEGEGSDQLILTVVTCDPGGVATSRRILTLTWDEELGSYVYDFQAGLEIHGPELFDRPETWARQDRVGFEYCDPWYADVPAPSVEFDGMWRKRYSHFLAEPADGAVWQMPLNHMATSIPSPRAFKRNGLLVLGFEPGHNPAFEFVEETADRTSIGVCNWGYDIHMQAWYDREELYAPPAPRFRLRLCPDVQVLDMISRAAPVPRIEYNGFTELPLYERKTSFARGLDLREPAPGPTDPWPWLPEGDGAEWCKDEGRSDSFSLKISKETPGPTEWTMNREGEGAWTQKWTPSIGFRIRAYIKTLDVRGKGSFLAARWAVYNHPERFPYICSQKLTGTYEWTLVEVEIQGPPPPGISAICIVLRQDGAGTTWFDDLEVEILDRP